jgi:hypothetical protein
LQPVPEVTRGEADRRDTFANQPANVAVRDAFAIINDNIHQFFAPVSHSLKSGRQVSVMTRPGRAALLFDDIFPASDCFGCVIRR